MYLKRKILLLISLFFHYVFKIVVKKSLSSWSWGGGGLDQRQQRQEGKACLLMIELIVEWRG